MKLKINVTIGTRMNFRGKIFPTLAIRAKSLAILCFGLAIAMVPETLLAQPRYENPIVFQRVHLDAEGEVSLRAKLWIMEADGSGLHQLTHGSTYDDHPSLYSDQEHVLYAEFPDNRLDRHTDARLIKVNIYSGAREIVAALPGCALHHATLSPIDDLLAYHRDCGERHAQWLDWGPDAVEVPLLASNGVRTTDGIIVMHEKNQGFSPREVALVYIRGHGASTRVEHITDDRALHRRAAISPDGQWIAWQTNVEGSGDEIYQARPDGSEVLNLTTASGNDGHPWFSRDGQWIVFESDRSGSWEIWRMELETRKVEQRTHGGRRYTSTRARM